MNFKRHYEPHKNNKNFRKRIFQHDVFIGRRKAQIRKLIELNPDEFYLSSTWIKLRDHTRKIYEKKCMKCSRKKFLQVDHVKSRSHFPELELNIRNLQILCSNCNQEKSNLNEIDFRSNKQKQLMEIYIYKNKAKLKQWL